MFMRIFSRLCWSNFGNGVLLAPIWSPWRIQGQMLALYNFVKVEQNRKREISLNYLFNAFQKVLHGYNKGKGIFSFTSTWNCQWNPVSYIVKASGEALYSHVSRTNMMLCGWFVSFCFLKKEKNKNRSSCIGVLRWLRETYQLSNTSKLPLPHSSADAEWVHSHLS